MGTDDLPTTAPPASATRYGAAIWGMAGAVVEHGDDLVIAAWSPGAARIFGYAAEEAVGRSVVGLLIQGEDEPAWRRLRDGGATEVLRFKRKDGAAVACSWRHAPLLDEQGRTSGTLCLGQDVTADEAARAHFEQSDRILRAVLTSIPIIASEHDKLGNFVFHEGKGLEGAGLTSGQYVGKNIFELHAGNKDIEEAMSAVLKGEARHTFGDALDSHWESWLVPLFGDDHEVTGAISIRIDATEAKRREKELQDQLDLIERQQKVIRDLATPIIEVWDGVLTLPMVGVLDSTRTADVMDNLLATVVAKRARFTILDLTGVEMVDTKTASYLIELVRAIRLLGAEGIITGIRPTVAQTMVALGMDLSGIATEANLRAGLKICMRRIREERIKAAAAAG